MTARDDYPQLGKAERGYAAICKRRPEYQYLLDDYTRALDEIDRLRASLRFPPTWTQSRAAAELEALRAEIDRLRANQATPEAQAVLDAAEAETDAEDRKDKTEPLIFPARHRRREAVRARRVAAGGTETQP